MRIPPATEPSLFWDVMSYLVVAACVLLILAMAIVLAATLIRGDRDDDDDDPTEGGGGESAPVDADARLLAARARLAAAARNESDHAHLPGLSDRESRVDPRTRTAAKGFRR